MKIIPILAVLTAAPAMAKPVSLTCKSSAETGRLDMRYMEKKKDKSLTVRVRSSKVPDDQEGSKAPSPGNKVEVKVGDQVVGMIGLKNGRGHLNLRSLPEAVTVTEGTAGSVADLACSFQSEKGPNDGSK